jgi:hypothetical protein
MLKTIAPLLISDKRSRCKRKKKQSSLDDDYTTIKNALTGRGYGSASYDKYGELQDVTASHKHDNIRENRGLEHANNMRYAITRTFRYSTISDSFAQANLAQIQEHLPEKRKVECIKCSKCGKKIKGTKNIALICYQFHVHCDECCRANSGVPGALVCATCGTSIVVVC